MPSNPPPLAQALRDARKAAGLRQLDVAPRSTDGRTSLTAMSQAQLSRIETGQSLPTEDEVGQLATLYRLPDDQRADLLQMARDARGGIRDSRLVVQRGNTLALQKRWREIESSATEVRSFQPVVVLGALQTAGYAAVAMQQPPDSEAVRDRLSRQATFDDPNRQLLLIQTEASLRQVVGSAAAMVEQLEAILDASHKAGVQLGVIPAATAMPFLVGSGFHIYDHSAVLVGLQVATARLTDPGDVDEFRTLFDKLAALAVWGDDARAELERIASAFNGTGS